MNYEKFKEKILEELRDLYGDSAEVNIETLQKNNGIHYDGIQINRREKDSKIAPVIRLDNLYEEYGRGEMDVEDCVQAVLRILKNNEIPKSIKRFVARIKDWDFVRKAVYPILLSTNDNRELLQKLVFTQVLDLSVAYIIRTPMIRGHSGSIKISRQLMEVYGISAEQLHSQAMENLRKDGYEFRDMNSIFCDLPESEVFDETRMDGKTDVKMHVLTNSCKLYGAAGILDSELLKKFAGNQDYFILPSSIHETIFVPKTSEFRQKDFDSMVAQVNKSELSPEERLVNHSYYYNARAGEIRMCF